MHVLRDTHSMMYIVLCIYLAAMYSASNVYCTRTHTDVRYFVNLCSYVERMCMYILSTHGVTVLLFLVPCMQFHGTQ